MRKFPSDKDGLFDFEEINFNLHTRNGQPLITFNSDGTVNLPNLNNLLWNYEDEYPYVASGFDKFKKDQALKADFYNVHGLPIKSDPTSEDGDGGYYSSVNLFYRIRLINRESLHKPYELLSCKISDLSFVIWPSESSVFNYLIQKDKAVIFPIQGFKAVSSSSAEKEQAVRKQIQIKLLLYYRRQTTY